MKQPEVDRDAVTRIKLDALDFVEREIEAVRPRNQLRENLLIFLLLAVAIGAGVAASIDSSVIRLWGFGLATLCALAAWVAIIAPRHRLKALKWKRDQLIAQIGDASRAHDSMVTREMKEQERVGQESGRESDFT